MNCCPPGGLADGTKRRWQTAARTVVHISTGPSWVSPGGQIRPQQPRTVANTTPSVNGLLVADLLTLVVRNPRRGIIAGMRVLLRNEPVASPSTDRTPFPGGAPSTMSAGEAYGVTRLRPAGRPWIGVCMVASLDGTTVVDHRSAGLSSEADRTVLATLRQLADVIIVGAGTVRAEGYGPPRKPGQRVGVVTRTGNVDTSTALFTSGAGFLIVPENAAQVQGPTVRAGIDEVDLVGAVAQLDADFVQAEGGASLNGALLDAGLIDELNLTIAPMLSGGDGPRVTRSAMAAATRMRLAHVLEDDGFLFTRYVAR